MFPILQKPAKKQFIIILFLIILGIAGWSTYSYFQTKAELKRLVTPEGQKQFAEQEVKAVLGKITKRMILPENETPTLATVTDVNALKKTQPFFEKAKNGDKVLVYVGAKKAIIYRPQEDLIVNVGFIAVDGDTISNKTKEQNPVTVEIRNGTETVGLGQRIADALKDTYKIASVSDANKKDYTETIVVDLNKLKDKTSITALSESLNAQTITEIPEGEKQSQADVIIFVGTNNVSE